MTGRETRAVWWGAVTVETITCDHCKQPVTGEPMRTYYEGDFCGFPCFMTGTAQYATNP